MATSLKYIIEHSEKKMVKTLTYLEKTFSRIRAGKANIHILDNIRVEYFGNMVALPKVSTLSISDSKTIIIYPWNKTMLQVIEKSIQNSNVGITPENNGEIIKLNIPPLTEESRKRLVKLSRTESENAKISIRNIRREAIENIKKSVKDGTSKDEGEEGENILKKMYDQFLKKIDKVFFLKEKDIMTI